MSSITISNLHPTGYNLFLDSESYLKELSEEELTIQGGITPAIAASSEPCGMAAVFGAAALYDWIFG